MQVYKLFKGKLLLAAVIVAASTSLVRADQNDRNKNNGQNGGQSGRSSSPPAARSSGGGNGGNSGNGGNAARSFSRPSNTNASNNSSNSNAGRNLQSQGNGGRSSSDSGNHSQPSFVQKNNSNLNVNNQQSSNKGNGSSNGSNGKLDRSVLKASANENVRLADNDDHKNQNGQNQNGQNGGNKGSQNNGNQNGGNKGNSNQNGGNKGNQNSGNQNGGVKVNQNFGNQNGGNKGESNSGNKGSQNGNNQNNGNQNGGTKVNQNFGNQNGGNKGESNSGNKGNQNGSNQNAGNNQSNGKNPGGNSPFKNGTANGANGNSKLPGNGFPGANNGSKFDKNFDKNGDHHDKDFNHDPHDGKHVDHVKDLFDHKVGDNHPNQNKVFHDHDFHGNDSSKAAFKQWNDVWKGKNGGGKDNRDWSGKWRSGDRFSAADAVRHDFYSHHDHDMHHMPFQANWWDSHHDHDHGWHFWGDYAEHHHHHPYYWWGWASAPALASYAGFGWSSPYYWDYGQGEYIYCNGGNVYVNGRMYESVPQYYAQTVQLIDQAPLLDVDAAAEAEWMPLGVFAVTPDGDNQPAVMMQLAITKTGILGGTATDPEAGASFNVQGTVDQKTQRAVWSYMDGDNNRIVLESSINNLTQNESTGMIHFGPNDQRVVELVRMPEPDESGALPMPQTLGTPAGGGPTLPPPEGQ